MDDEQQIDIQSLLFTRTIALTIDAWPQYISVTDAWLEKQAYRYGATVDGDTIAFAVGNGEARYQIHRDQRHGTGYVAELVEGNTPANLKSRKAKYETKTGT